MDFNELLTLVGSAGGPNVQLDSRLVKKGDVFVAIEGTACDGRDFIDSALKNGAAFIVARSSSLEARNFCFVEVENTREAAAMLAQAAVGNPAKRLVNLAVTGTNGKTTVAFLVQSCIAAAGGKCGLIGTVLYDTCGSTPGEAPLTTPDCVTIAQAQKKMLENGAKYMVIEASSHALSQERLCQIDFRAAAFTNLTGDHLDYHGCEAEYLAAKARLFSTLSANATAVLNCQSPHSRYISAKTKAGILWYGLDGWGDLTANIDSMDIEGSVFQLSYAGSEVEVRTPLLGRHNISNHLAAAGLCLAAGIDLKTVAKGLSSLEKIPGRLEKVNWAGPFAVLIDYAHTDDALKNVLTTLKPLCKGSLRVLFGCGGDRDRTKRPRMANVAEKLADVVVVTSDNPRTENPDAIIREIIAGFQNKESVSVAQQRATSDELQAKIFVEPDRKKAIELILSSAQPNDIVLIAGKGHEDYQIIGKTKHHFSDIEIAQQFLTQRKI